VANPPIFLMYYNMTENQQGYVLKGPVMLGDIAFKQPAFTGLIYSLKLA
jgi:hypothetical protein